MEELFMSYHNSKSDQRRRNRLQMKKSLFATIRGNLEGSVVRIKDMNADGLGCSIDGVKKIEPMPVVLDLVSTRNRTLIRSLTACIVFTDRVTQTRKDARAVRRRCGISFVNLSTLQTRLLNRIIAKYAILSKGEDRFSGKP